ncbi:YlbF family regulator [Lactococcus insecticola]|uniref:Uncharacterized protein n=1 Tax=Pseudolactococcus insecticola TaxID=2709158 RepID=A0A6A0B4S3_9LACT|nr:YlbF family regulator [Lactococcus insecticola]GFH40360.1 hypothetical protein Hs20B_07580 [Lactococcus insecticola]
MPSPENQYEAAVSALKAKLAQHPDIIKFQKAERRLKAAKTLYDLETEMKDLSQDATLYKKINKKNAYKATMARAKEIELTLNEEPLIIDYRRRLVAANAVLQHVLENLETQINEELHYGN